jgi:hypothetical protein
MVGYHPARCPFCGAPQERFITSEECSARFKVRQTPVNDRVTRLNSVPPLGYEHAAFHLKSDRSEMWIDCPSSFDSSLKPVDAIIFTHHHFLGTSNLYREHFSAQVRIHRSDSSHGLCRGFVFDDTFQEDIAENGLEAFHVNGHTPGFTFYIFGNTLLICDYVFYNERSIQFNPYGPRIETEQAAQKIREIIDSRSIDKVCGYNYVSDYAEWKSSFDRLLEGRPNRDI